MNKIILGLSMMILSFPLRVSAEEIKITVRGMVCSFCAQGIKKSFSALEQVESVDVNLDNKLVDVHTKQGMPLSDDQVSKIISDAGYDTVKIERGS